MCMSSSGRAVLDSTLRLGCCRSTEWKVLLLRPSLPHILCRPNRAPALLWSEFPMENLRRMRWSGILLGAFVLLGLACNLGGSDGTEPPAAATQPAGGGEEQQPPSGGSSEAGSSLDDIHTALVQIEAQGTLIAPAVGLQRNA